MVRKRKRYDISVDYKRRKSRRNVKFIDAGVNERVIMRVFTGPCEFSYVTVSVTPDVGKVVVLRNRK